jgi:hypothetical protein
MDLVLSALLLVGIVLVLYRLHLIECMVEKANTNSIPPLIEEECAKKPGANRRPRTDEQKELASRLRKEWWAKKKASDELTTPSEAVEKPKQN